MGNIWKCEKLQKQLKELDKIRKKRRKKIRPEGFWVFAQSRGICEFSVPILGLNPVKRLSRGVASRVSAARHQGGTAKTSGHNGSWDVSGKRESYLVMLMPSFSRYLQTALKRQALAI
jgi:hypothetical protein